MKIKVLNVLKFLVILGTGFLFGSCAVGLGEAVDTEPPVLKILTPSNMDYVPKSYVISGTCSDNHAIGKIEVKNTKTNEFLGNANFSGNTWTYYGIQENNGELPLTITAIDKFGNIGESSIGQITVVIDSESPELDSFYIKRAGKYLVYFSEKEKLAEYVTKEKDTVSKDYLQNEKIEFVGKVSDNIRADKSFISIYDDNNNLILSNIPQDQSSNAYTPSFTITQSQLENVNPSLSSGSHYLIAKLDLFDAAGGKTEVTKKYFCWYPEADKPKVDFTISNNNEIEVGKNTDIPVNIFDDDGIAEIHSKIVTREEWNSIYNSESKTFSLAGFTKKTSEGSRDLTIKEKASEIPGDYVYAVAVKDKKADGSEGVWVYTWCNVTVSADSVPIIIVDSPIENATPELRNNKFTISGYSLFNQQVKKAAIAWIPNGYGETNGIPKAKELLSSINFSTFSSATDLESGIKYKKLTLSQGKEKIGEINYEKSSFSEEFDVTSFFEYDNQIENAVKTFLIYFVSQDGTGVYKTFRLGSYSDGPTISIKSGSEELSDMTTEIALGTTFNLKIRAKGYNGLKLKSISGYYKAENDESPTEITDLSIDNEREIPLTISKDQRYTLTVEAEDIFGTKTKVTKVFVPGTVAALTKISSGMKKGIILTEGQTLKIQAEFSNPVSNMNDTKIELKNINGISGKQYAVCKENKITDTVIYEYKVPDGAYTNGSVAVESGTLILSSTNETRYTLTDSTQTLGKNSEIYIDAVAPAIESYLPLENGVIDSDKQIKITFNDSIFLESGTITVERSTGWFIPPVIPGEEFTTIYAALSDEEKIAMIGSKDGNPKLTENSAMPEGPYKKVTHGVKENSEGKTVPDSATKYVLAFDLEISDTTQGGAVQKIREALENYGYHKQDFDISDTEISIDSDGKTLVIDLSETDLLVNGREFTVTIPAGCVRDAAGNVNKELVRDTYKFWSEKTAAPVIRTDRYTHGADAVEPYLEGGVIKTNKVGLADVTTKPTGQIRVKIDCETPGATIKYGVKTNSATLLTTTSDNTKKVTKVDDLVNAEFKALVCNKDYSTVFLLGKEGWEEAEKNYIKATAKKGVSGLQPALSDSDAGYEQATKTVLYYAKPNGEDATTLYFQGSDSMSEPIISGFPMRDANTDMRYSRYAYKINTSATKASESDWVCVSWDIITSGWRLQSITKSWQNPEYKNLDFGIGLYVNTKTYW